MTPDFTFEEFVSAAKEAGLYDQFSEADLKLAQENPAAGMSILQSKIDWNSAETDEQRAQANTRAEGTRSSHGGYTGGTDGGSFYLDPLSPGSFDGGTAPTYTNNYTDQINDLFQQQTNYGSFNYGSAPSYTNRYDDTLQDLLQGVLNREDFTYNPETDPLYSQYRKQYAREGQRATADALGAAAAASGGLPSSYAQTAAAQAGNYYAAQMTDKIPELYQLAYNKYLNDYNMKLSDISTVQSYEQSDYNKYLNELNQYNTDRNFDYNAWMDQYNMINNNLNTAVGLEQLDYTKYLNDLSQYNTDRAFNYQQLLDEVDSQTLERQEALQEALYAAEVAGDYSLLEDRGWDVSNNPEQWQREYELAMLDYEINGNPARLNALMAKTFGDSGTQSGQGTAYVDGPGGYNNGTLSESQVAALQRHYGVTADGMWGPNSAAAAGGLSAEAAWQAYLAGGGDPNAGSGGGGGGGGNPTPADNPSPETPEAPKQTDDTPYYTDYEPVVTAAVRRVEKLLDVMAKNGSMQGIAAGYILRKLDKGEISEKGADYLMKKYGLGS